MNPNIIRATTHRLRSGPRGGVLALVTGSAAGQAIALVSTPLLARLYSPESFGIFSYLFSACAVLTAVASLRFETAIPLAGSVDESRALTRVSISLAVLVSLAAAAVITTSHGAMSDAAGFDILPWAWWVPPLVLLTAWFNVLSQAAIRERAYSKVAARTFVQSLGVAVGQVGSAAITRSAGGLLTGQLIGRSLGILALARTARHLLLRPPAGVARRAIRRYWRFPALLAPSALLNTLGTNLPIILIGAWFGPHAAGYLGLTQRIAMVPTALVAVAVGQVFSGELAARLRDDESDNRRLYLRTSRQLAVGAAAVAAALLLLSDWAFPFVLGDDWASSGGYAEAIALSVGAGFVVSPVSFVFIAYQRILTNVLVDLSRILLVGGFGTAAFVAGFSPVESLWAMSIAQVLNYLITWIIGLKVAAGPGRSAHDTRGDSPTT
jgi:O-antigen/teichoic acid export membrane protein